MNTNLSYCFKEIANNIKKLRLKYNYTQQEMATILGMDKMYYSRLERAKEIPTRKFTIEHILILCAHFNITPNDLITKIPKSNELKIDTEKLQKDIFNEIKRMNIKELLDLKVSIHK